MQELDDSALLRQYTESHSEEAFAVLVTRHINKVYSVALRHTRNPHQAEEITQAVFVILAGKAGSLGKGVILSGWLYQTARLASVTFLRSEIRRARREQEAHMQRVQDEPTTYETWWQIAPLLDVAMAKLSEKDRHAVVLRFFDGKSMSEVGAALGATEDAAKKRVNRALEKLQRFFAKRGVSSTTAVIAGALSANSVQAAPAALAKSVTAVAMAKGATASVSTLTLIKGALKVMAWTNAKTAIVIGAGLILMGGTATVIVRHDRIQDETIWRTEQLSSLKPMIIVRPTKFERDYPYGFSFSDGDRFRNVNQTITNLLEAAYGFSPERMVSTIALPNGHYDCLDTAAGPRDALKLKIQREFKLIAHSEIRNADVLLLEANDTRGGPGLQPAKPRNVAGGGLVAHMPDSMQFYSATMETLAANLEDLLSVPVIDETGLSTRFDMTLKWNTRSELNQALDTALNEQLGLTLVPTNMPIEMLVVEKAQ